MTAKRQANPDGSPAALKSPLTAFLLEMSGHVMVSLTSSLRHQSMSMAEFASVSLLLTREPLRINELAEALDHPLPAASRVVSSLVERGLVERREDPDDRRAKVLTLTPAGRALMDGLAATLADRVEASLADMAGSVSDTMRPVFAALRRAEGATAPPWQADKKAGGPKGPPGKPSRTKV
jgi:MarR family transcriptional regulator, organic hydroperoxide resistance regulator